MQRLRNLYLFQVCNHRLSRLVGHSHHSARNGDFERLSRQSGSHTSGSGRASSGELRAVESPVGSLSGDESARRVSGPGRGCGSRSEAEVGAGSGAGGSAGHFFFNQVINTCKSTLEKAKTGGGRIVLARLERST